MQSNKDRAIKLLEDFGDSVDIFYTQFLEVAFFLKVPATERIAIAFVKRKLPLLSEDDIKYLITEITASYRETL
jgi:hypothetical protein|tara:strand:+ start:1513 stop:1734 length:222 start_codon:yes stop_codon:yes gene_type:complete